MKLTELFGDIRQNGYIVRDLPAAIRTWTQALGVGPFFVQTDVAVPVVYKGSPVTAQLSVGFAQYGDLQIELTQQLNDVPTIWHQFISSGCEGFHHAAFWTKNFDRDLAAAKAKGLEPVQSSQGKRHMVYFEPRPGFVFELSEGDEAADRLRQHIAEASRTWDGSDPVRPMTLPR